MGVWATIQEWSIRKQFIMPTTVPTEGKEDAAGACCWAAMRWHSRRWSGRRRGRSHGQNQSSGSGAGCPRLCVSGSSASATLTKTDNAAIIIHWRNNSLREVPALSPSIWVGRLPSFAITRFPSSPLSFQEALMSQLRRASAELLGTFWLVFGGLFTWGY